MMVGDSHSKDKKRLRAWKTKVRSGCMTCKERRVKCDEIRPSCHQCSRVSRECGGYHEVKVQRPKVHLVNQNAALLPKPPSNVQPLIYTPYSCLFKDDQEQFCFRHFCDGTSAFLSGPFGAKLWSQLIPQACEVHLSVRHACIAVAALSLMSEEANCSSVGQKHSDKVIAQTKLYHQFALQQYSRALIEMRKAITGGTQDTRTALVNSIVIICFETFYGNQDSALGQLRAGLRLINTWFDDRARSMPAATQSLTRRNCAEIQEELVQAYARLDIHVLMLMKSTPIKGNVTMAQSVLAGTETMPAKFLSVEEAREYQGSIQRRLLQLFNSEVGEAVVSEWHVSSRSTYEIPPCFLATRDKLLAELMQWNMAFDPMLQRLRSKPGEASFQAALILQLHYMTTYFTVSCLPSDKQMRSRDFMPLFAEMISIARTILDHSKWAVSGFTFDGQTVKPLFSIAVKCPNGALRRQAISLLLSSPRREGFWDSTLTAKLAEWIMGLEEEDVEDDYVPDETRIRNLRVKANLQKRTAYVECLKPEITSPEMLIPRRAVLKW